MRIVRCSLPVLVGAFLTLAGNARAQDAAQPSIDDIREMVLYARYRDAIDAAQHYIERPGLSAREKNAAFEVLATAQLAVRDRHASETLEQLYRRDPGHILSDPGASPTVQAAFQRAREETAEHVEPALIHDPPELVTRLAPSIEVQLGEGGDAVDEVRVSYRQSGDPRFTAVTMDVDESGVARARLPLSEGQDPYTIEYHIQALAPSGAVLASIGSPDEPLTIEVPEATAESTGAASAGVSLLPGPGERPPEDEGGSGVLSQWWFWTAVALVIGGGVVAYLLLSSGDEQPPQGTLGTFPLE